MSAEAKKCASCGAPFVARVEDGCCTACGVDPFLVEVVGQKRALADALASQAHDVHSFVQKLAEMLEEGFADKTEIKTSGVFTKHISEILVTLGSHVYRLSVKGKHATGHRSRHVRGIKVKEEDLELSKFLEELSDDLAEAGAQSRAAQAALSKFIR
jgi:hypothetical protein